LGNTVHCVYPDHSDCQNTVAYWNNGNYNSDSEDCKLWTFDWYDWNYSAQNATIQNGFCQENRKPNVILSNRCIGIFGKKTPGFSKEGIKSELLQPLIPSHGYGLEFDLFAVWDPISKNHNRILDDSTTLIISFCTEANNWCDNIKKTLKVTLGPNQINQWHHIKLDFFYSYPPSKENINSLPKWNTIVVYADENNPQSYFYKQKK